MGSELSEEGEWGSRSPPAPGGAPGVVACTEAAAVAAAETPPGRHPTRSSCNWAVQRLPSERICRGLAEVHKASHIFTQRTLTKHLLCTRQGSGDKAGNETSKVLGALSTVVKMTILNTEKALRRNEVG